MARYFPESPTVKDLESAVEWMLRELQRIGGVLEEGSVARHSYEVLHAAPSKPREGQLVYADGTDWNPGAGKGLYEYTGTEWRRLYADPPPPPPPVSSGCRLEVASATSLTLYPFTSPYVPVYDGVQWTATSIPYAGVTITNAGLSANTTYDIYLYLNGTTPTLELSTTPPALDPTVRLYIKSGDPSRVYLGAVRTNASTQFTSNETNRSLYNHYNRLPLALHNINSGGSITLNTTDWTDTGVSVSALIPPIVGTTVELEGHVSGYKATSATTISAGIWSTYTGTWVSNGEFSDSATAYAWAHAAAVFRGNPVSGMTTFNLRAWCSVTPTIIGANVAWLRGLYYG